MDIPNNPQIIIQKVAPGPPNAIARATPAIFPFPTVPETAVASAWKWETSPSSDFESDFSTLSYFPLTTLIEVKKYLMLGKPKYNVKNKALATSSNITNG